MGRRPSGLTLLAAAIVVATPACKPKSTNNAAPSASASASGSASSSSSAEALPSPPTTGLAAAPELDAAPAGKPEDIKSPGPPVRETKVVKVDGIEETWRLQWRKPPKMGCIDETWSTCLCNGFAYSEIGEMDLIRIRGPESPEERLNLNKLTEEVEVQRWIPSKSDSDKYGFKPVPLEEVTKRPVALIMQLGDYDHDGAETEFLFRIGIGGPCGHNSMMMVIGVSKKNPKLHAFGTVEQPKGHILLHTSDWEKVRKAADPSKPLKLVQFPCGDHGGETEESTLLHIDEAGIHTKSQKRQCKPGE